MVACKVTLILLLVSLAAASPFLPIHAPKPYAFGYTVKDKHGEQYREEKGDGVGVVKGSYGFKDERGVHRIVHYVADKAGFRAEVKTNEHGTAPLNPAAVKMISSAHPYFGGAGHKKSLSGGLAPLGLASKSALSAAPVAAGLPYGGFVDGESYAAPLLGGAITGYDSRFGAY